MKSDLLNVLIIGNGGREHALAWKVSQSYQINNLYVAPGNAGTALVATNLNILPSDFTGLTDVIREKKVDLVIVGPEQPLAAGIVNYLNATGVSVFGPTKEAAQIESSKIFARKLMKKYGIRYPVGSAFSSFKKAYDYLIKQASPYVIKADGLAAGKGIVITESLEEAASALENMMHRKSLGLAGMKTIIDQYVTGKEVSLLAFTDGKTIKTMVPACDYKKAYDRDSGPNTGGMGCYCRPGFFSSELEQEAINTILKPIIEGMSHEGIIYKGVIYAGLMVKEAGELFVLEFNCRFGDPETQVVLPLLKTDLLDICMAVVNDELHTINIEWDEATTLGVVMASSGYPGSYEKGFDITGLNNMMDEDIFVFHAGTKQIDNSAIASNGGRVLAVVSKGNSVMDARKKVYENIDTIKFKNSFYRKDIGLREGG